MVGQRRLQDEMRIISILGFGASYIRDFTVVSIMGAGDHFTKIWAHFESQLPKVCKLTFNP